MNVNILKVNTQILYLLSVCVRRVRSVITVYLSSCHATDIQTVELEVNVLNASKHRSPVPLFIRSIGL